MPSSRPSLCLLLLTVLWAVIYLPALGRRELQGEEARRVLPGRTMLQTGEWIVPRSGGMVYNRKPPLVNWMSAAAISITGRMDEWMVRTPSTLMMLALSWSVFLFMRGSLGNETAFLAAVITLTSIGFIEKGRLIEIEALYLSLFGIAMAAWLGLHSTGRELAAWVVSGLVLGLGFLAKGPLHVFYFYAVVLGVLASTGKLRGLLSWKHLLGLACFVAVWTPWALMNSARNPNQDSGKVWAEQITHRLGFVEFNVMNYLMQIPQSLINFLPWALLLPLAWRLYRSGDDPHSKWMRGMSRGLFWAFIVIAVLPSSRPRFMLPLNVVASILVAAALTRLDSQKLASLGRRWCAAMLLIGLIMLMVLMVAVRSGGEWAPWHWALWAAAFLLMASAWRWMFRQDRTRPVTMVLVTALVFATAVSAAAFETLTFQPWRSELREFAAVIESHTGKTEPILLYKVGERMWPFYLGMRCYETGFMRDRPQEVDFRWLIVGEKVWSDTKERAAVEERFGKVTTEVPLREPRDEDDYRLWGTTPNR